MNHLIANEAIYRTAPATPGLLNIKIFAHLKHISLNCNFADYPYLFKLVATVLTKQVDYFLPPILGGFYILPWDS